MLHRQALADSVVKRAAVLGALHPRREITAGRHIGVEIRRAHSRAGVSRLVESLGQTRGDVAIGVGILLRVVPVGNIDGQLRRAIP